jgi:hypothetical protein
VIEREGEDVRVASQDGVNGPPQVPDPFAVDDADPVYPAIPARLQIVGHQVLYFFGPECMQVQHSVDGHFNRLVHAICDSRLQRNVRRETGAAQSCSHFHHS